MNSDAQSEFASILKRLLGRPPGYYHQCRFCGFDNYLETADILLSNCLFTGYELIRYKCKGCQGVFGPVQLINCDPSELGEMYTCLYKFYSEGPSEPYQEKTFYLLNPSSQSRYLNYVCGAWENGCHRLRSLGWDIKGYEPFQTNHSSDIIISGDISSQGLFDGIMSHNYVEHVQDPMAFFDMCYNMLRPSGIMAHSSACFEYLFEVSPLHLFFYCGQAVEMVARKSGFTILSEYRSDMDKPGHQYVCYNFKKIQV